MKKSQAMTDELILSRLYQLPEALKKEVLHYIGFLQKKHVDQAQSVVHKKRQFGSTKNKYKLSTDFNAPLEDFKDYM